MTDELTPRQVQRQEIVIDEIHQFLERILPAGCEEKLDDFNDETEEIVTEIRDAIFDWCKSTGICSPMEFYPYIPDDVTPDSSEGMSHKEFFESEWDDPRLGKPTVIQQATDGTYTYQLPQ
jgi:hypothetical protein